jgi:hypothetical protein
MINNTRQQTHKHACPTLFITLFHFFGLLCADAVHSVALVGECVPLSKEHVAEVADETDKDKHT